MAIIISKNGGNAKKLDRKDFEFESKMLDYVSANPEVIPVEDVKENTKMVLEALMLLVSTKMEKFIF
ncbi:MAG: hypothetical protein B6U86_04840 [Candidatus Altiarchaeales archaeon ex4484_43]|nr:MAG: hypothetical protein B6U86_04840 [Candidatus Altiarchaeales archaeon ex4484_43]